MTSQKNPDRRLNFLRHEDGSWNLLVILGGALGAVFVTYMLLDSPSPVPKKNREPLANTGAKHDVAGSCQVKRYNCN
jgi:hypothetical protein